MASVIFLRGMNIGKRRVTNDELIAVFSDAGYGEVSAYQASGNIIIGDDSNPEAATVSEFLATALGYDVAVFVRSASGLQSMAASSPIAGATGDAGGKPQIVFLSHGFSGNAADAFPEGHEVHHIGSELHWLPPVGLSELGAITSTMDRILGMNTVRTLGTIERLAKRLVS